MPGVLGSPVPGRLGVGSGARFPWTYTGTYVDPTGAITLPSGWGRLTWYAYRATLGKASRGDVILIGDSTTYGSGALYSYVQRIRDQATGDTTGGPTGFGMTDGGKGIFASGEGAIAYGPPEVNGLVTDGFDNPFGPDQYDNLDGQFYYDTGTTAGDTLTLQFRAATLRLWYSQRSNAGQFTYNIDSTGAVTVNAHGPGPVSKFVTISGLSAGQTHTIVIKNLGGLPPNPPATTSASGNGPGSGTLTPGTYYYVATYVFGTGTNETIAGPVANATVASNRSITCLVPDVGQGAGKTNLYRGTSPTGPFSSMAIASTGPSGGFYSFVDDGSVSPGGSNPPNSGTTNLNTSSPALYIGAAPINATGVVFNKQATSGDTINGRFFGGVAASPYTAVFSPMRYQTAVGLTTTTVAAPSYTGAPRDTSHDSDGGRITPVLALSNLGFNDLSGWTDTQANLNALCTSYVQRFAGMCADAGCDGVIISGQLPYNANWYTLGIGMYNTLKAQAAALGLGFVDLFYPIGGLALNYAGGTGNPHLTTGQYQSQGDFLWNSLLGLR